MLIYLNVESFLIRQSNFFISLQILSVCSATKIRLIKPTLCLRHSVIVCFIPVFRDVTEQFFAMYHSTFQNPFYKIIQLFTSAKPIRV